jgi:lipopolysaccharide heptosyltransferase II
MILSTVSVFIKKVLAPVAFFFDRHHRSIILRNLKIVFPKMREPQRQQMAMETFEQSLINFFVGVADIPPERIQIKGVEYLEACRKKGRGAVLLLSHFGNWELMTKIGALLPQFDFSMLVESTWRDRLLQPFRVRGNVKMLKRKTDMMEACHRVKRGNFVIVFSDRIAGDNGMWIPFFGKLACTSVEPLILKGKTDAALIPVFCRSTGPDKWRIEFSEEIESEATQGETLYRMHQRLEEEIEERAEHYSWLYNRWKIPDQHIFFYHYRRGFYHPSGIPLKRFRVLVRGVNWLGDAVMTIPALRALKTGRPDSHITLITESKLADFWKNQYYIDRVVTEDEPPLEEEFDVGIVFPNSFHSAMQIYQHEVDVIVGYAGEFPRRLLLDIVVPDSCRAGFRQHDINDFLGLADYIGAQPAKRIPEYGMLKNLIQRRDTIALHLGSSYGSAKRWFEDRFVELAKRFPEYHWLLIGAPDEMDVNQQAAARIGKNAVAAETSLSDLGKLLASVRCLVCNDSGPMHFAAAVGTPVIAIFGSTEPSLTGPLGSGHEVVRETVECSPCFRRECPIDLRCMKAVSVDAVEKALRRVLEKAGAARVQHEKESDVKQVRG